MEREKIKELISNSITSEIVCAWNRVCEENNDYENEVFENEENALEEMFSGNVDSALRAAFYGDYRYPDSFCCFDGYGNLVSFDYYDDENSPIDIEQIVDYFENNQSELPEFFDVDIEDYEEENC